MNGEHMAAILVSNRGLTTDRLKDDDAVLAKFACVIGRTAAGAHNATEAILSCRCVSIGQQRGASRIPVFTCGEIVGPAAHRKRPRQRAACVVLENEPANTITV